MHCTETYYNHTTRMPLEDLSPRIPKRNTERVFILILKICYVSHPLTCTSENLVHFGSKAGSSRFSVQTLLTGTRCCSRLFVPAGFTQYEFSGTGATFEIRGFVLEGNSQLPLHFTSYFLFFFFLRLFEQSPLQLVSLSSPPMLLMFAV